MKSGMVKKKEDKPSNEALKENKKLELDLKEQIKLHAAEQETENQTEKGMHSPKRAGEANLKQVNISAVHIRLKQERSNPLEARLPKRSKTEMMLQRCPSHPESLN